AYEWSNGDMVGEAGKPSKLERIDTLCGARFRDGTTCDNRPAVRPDGRVARRCAAHGGLSTGPRTSEGLARMRAAVGARARRDWLELRLLETVLRLRGFGPL